jgi:hypothetical protein
MRKIPIDAASVTRRALYGMDEGWYDAYWCKDRPAAKPRLLSRVVRQLVNATAAAAPQEVVGAGVVSKVDRRLFPRRSANA